jgi:membrane protein insertase Oxa1/YidC/SpoIIIJ
MHILLKLISNDNAFDSIVEKSVIKNILVDRKSLSSKLNKYYIKVAIAIIIIIVIIITVHLPLTHAQYSLFDFMTASLLQR